MIYQIYPMLVVDKDIEVSMREQAEWLKHGIPAVRVNTMQEAIEKLTKEPFLFTAINADNIHYLPLLKVMRDTGRCRTPCPGGISLRSYPSHTPRAG